MKTPILALGVASVGFLIVSPAVHATHFGPTAFLKAADSPFASMSFSSFYLQDFESIPHATLANTLIFNPGGPSIAKVTQLTPVVIKQGPLGQTDSVDADDGVLDNDGTLGTSLFNASGVTGITFHFSGTLPTHAGIVWTDGSGTQNFEAFDQDGVSLGIITGNHDTAGITGQADEDRFYGESNVGGISKFKIWNTSGGIEVDHLQFGIGAPATPGSVPDTVSTLGTLAACMLGLSPLRRRT